MTSLNSSHAEKTHQASSKQSAPKVQVQRSVSRETITIHFCFGKEEEEEEEEFMESLDEELDDQSIVTGEAKEDLDFESSSRLICPVAPRLEESSLPTSAVKPTVNTVLALETPASKEEAVPLSLSSQPCPDKCSSPTELKSTISSPSKSPALTTSTSTASVSNSKPFMSLVKSLSRIEPKEPTPPVRHRHLMKSLVKSLSTDTSKQDSEASYKPPDSINLHYLKFTQPRVTGGDSKTAPSSPITSPSDGRYFFITEVRNIEDTKRRFSEVIYEPLQLLSKIMGESLSYRPKALSSSASELTNLSINGHLDNNNYSIKEEEGDSADYSICDSVKDEKKTQGENVKDLDCRTTQPAKDTDFRLSRFRRRISLSALASRDEEFTELYAEDFDFEDDEPISSWMTLKNNKNGILSKRKWIPMCNNLIYLENIIFLSFIVIYGYLTPFPSYLGLFMGVGLGFMAAILTVFFASPRSNQHKLYQYQQLLSVQPLQINEPEIMKGWMNEIQNYDPETYHATLTHSVFVRLEGSTLRLSKPNKNVSRRAIFNETKPEVTYISQKIYDLVDSKVYLVPKSLARKRVWNKKYPICLELARQDDFMSKAQTENTEDKTPVEKVDQSTEESKKQTTPQDGTKTTGHKEQVLYLFGRTGREKEEWFRKFLLASKMKSEAKKPSNAPGMKPGLLLSHSRQNSQSGLLTHSRSSSKGSMDEVMSQPKPKELSGNVRQKMLLDYNVYMAKCIPQEEKSPIESPVHSANSSPTATKKITGVQPTEGEEQQAWVNSLLGRMFWDFLGEKYWSDLVSKKIQMKLSKIKLPYFMNELTLTELDMGVSVPKILQAFKPTIDHRGLWTDLEISYNGSFLMTLETKMNLTRLGKEPLGEALKVGEFGKEGARPRAYYLADSDEESSSAGSSDEDDAAELTGDKQLTPGAEGYPGPHRTSKIMRFVDKITKSKYFQKATETEFIKKKIEEVSNTPLLLTVEVQECTGTLTINIPPPPTDRIWYGFRKPPHLELKARPKLGEREVTLAHVTEWIEKKLEQEFQKIFVMPNMDDLYVSIMHSVMDPRSSKETESEVDEQ
ncbi:LOW QUALITY PROTEIN: testis-expressed protein 2 [Discoglossus pictus]